MAEKDATEKSDAVREALLAELDRDSKKAAKGGNDNSRQTQEKTKDKKKNKDYKKPKDSKVLIFGVIFFAVMVSLQNICLHKPSQNSMHIVI